MYGLSDQLEDFSNPWEQLAAPKHLHSEVTRALGPTEEGTGSSDEQL